MARDMDGVAMQMKQNMERTRAMADNQRDGRRRKPGGAPEHPLDNRQAANPVQNLGQLRLHARALAGSQNDDVKIRGTWDGQPSNVISGAV